MDHSLECRDKFLKKIFDSCATIYSGENDEQNLSFRDFENAVRLLRENLLAPQNSTEYWKKRCELAENFIEESPDDPDVTNSQADAYWEWKLFIKESENIIIPDRLHEPDEVGEVEIKGNYQQIKFEPTKFIIEDESGSQREIKALDLYVTAMRNAMSKVGELTPWRSEDFDNLFMHINNLKMLAGITSNEFDVKEMMEKQKNIMINVSGIPPKYFGKEE